VANVEGRATAITVLSPVRPGGRFLLAAVFWVGRNVTATLKKLHALSFIHYARWAVIRRFPDGGDGERLHHTYLFFESNFNGTWDQYIDAFSDGIPNGLDLFWYSSTKYPHSIPVTPFKDYIRKNQVDTDYYYNATPGSAQRDIKAALRVYSALTDLADRHASLTPEQFAVEYRKTLVSIQNDLPSAGLAPVAGNDTANADANRIPFIKARWPGAFHNPAPSAPAHTDERQPETVL
jgi:hypothetical protein